MDMSLEDIEQQLRQHPELKTEVIQFLMSHPLATASKLKPGRANFERIWNVAHGIDKVSRQQQQANNANPLSDEEVARIKELESDPGFANKFAKNHKEIVRERFLRLTGRWEDED